MTEFETIAKLLEGLLEPIRSNINDLKDSQKQIMSLLLTQTRMDEKMKRVDEHLADCVAWRKKTEESLEEKEDAKEIVLWDIIKILLYILGGGAVGSSLAKFIFH